MQALRARERVTKRYPRGERGRREQVALRDLSLEVRPGELVGVWGTRHSGRSTLALLAAGIVDPTDGAVCFDGEPLSRRPMLGMRGGIGWCDRAFDRVIAETVLEHVAAPLLTGDRSNRDAERTAYELLQRVGAADCSELE